MKKKHGQTFRKQSKPSTGPMDGLFESARAHHGAGQLAEAEALYREVLQANANHPDALHLLGVLACQVGQAAPGLELIDRAIAVNPDFAEAHFSRGNALYGLQRYQAAVESYNRAIELKPDYVDAYANRGGAQGVLGRFQAAVESYDHALFLRPDLVEAHYNRGNALSLLQQYQAAAESYSNAIRLRPEFAEAYVSRGNALHALQQYAAALENYDEAIRLRPDFPEAHSNRGSALFALQRYEEALESSDKAILLKPDNADAYSNRGASLHALKQYAVSLESCERAILLNPQSADAHYNRGNALHALERHEEALESYDQALLLNARRAEIHNNRGVALLALQRFPEALESYDEAIRLNPAYADTYCNRGNTLQAMREYAAAVESYDRSILLKPDNADAYYNRGNVQQVLNQYKAALESYEKTALCDPEHEYLRGMRLHMRRFMGDWEGLEGATREMEACIERGEKGAVPFQVLAMSTSPALQRRAAEIHVRHKFPASASAVAMPRRATQDKIRIGYFSADYHNHATTYLMAELLERHDRSRFEILGFSFGPNREDEMRGRVSNAMDRFLDVRLLPDREVAQLSRDLEVDIAVDLKGFTQDSRTGIFAARAAPIQVSYLGYPGTMGADYIDYLIADPTLIPEDSRQYYSEKIVYLPDSYQVNDSQRMISAKACARVDEGLPDDAFVYCCFNNAYKITPAVFDVWMRVLGRVEGSVLWLLEENQWVAGNLRKEAVRRGIAPERLVFAKPLPLAEHLARQRLADLFLDTLPYNAHTTASDALWAGLPVLTRMGETFAGRVAASLLRAIDLPELVTTTEAEFEELAVALARDGERYRGLRQQLQENRLSAPLFNIRAFTRHLEAAYSAMYERYQAGLAPEHIEIARIG